MPDSFNTTVQYRRLLCILVFSALHSFCVSQMSSARDLDISGIRIKAEGNTYFADVVQRYVEDKMRYDFSRESNLREIKNRLEMPPDQAAEPPYYIWSQYYKQLVLETVIQASCDDFPDLFLRVGVNAFGKQTTQIMEDIDFRRKFRECGIRGFSQRHIEVVANNFNALFGNSLRSQNVPPDVVDALLSVDPDFSWDAFPFRYFESTDLETRSRLSEVLIELIESDQKEVEFYRLINQLFQLKTTKGWAYLQQKAQTSERVLALLLRNNQFLRECDNACKQNLQNKQKETDDAELQELITQALGPVTEREIKARITLRHLQELTDGDDVTLDLTSLISHDFTSRILKNYPEYNDALQQYLISNFFISAYRWTDSDEVLSLLSDALVGQCNNRRFEDLIQLLPSDKVIQLGRKAVANCPNTDMEKVYIAEYMKMTRADQLKYMTEVEESIIRKDLKWAATQFIQFEDCSVVPDYLLWFSQFKNEAQYEDKINRLWNSIVLSRCEVQSFLNRYKGDNYGRVFEGLYHNIQQSYSPAFLPLIEEYIDYSISNEQALNTSSLSWIIVHTDPENALPMIERMVSAAEGSEADWGVYKWLYYLGHSNLESKLLDLIVANTYGDEKFEELKAIAAHSCSKQALSLMVQIADSYLEEPQKAEDLYFKTAVGQYLCHDPAVLETIVKYKSILEEKDKSSIVPILLLLNTDESNEMLLDLLSVSDDHISIYINSPSRMNAINCIASVEAANTEKLLLSKIILNENYLFVERIHAWNQLLKMLKPQDIVNYEFLTKNEDMPFINLEFQRQAIMDSPDVKEYQKDDLIKKFDYLIYFLINDYEYIVRHQSGRYSISKPYDGHALDNMSYKLITSSEFNSNREVLQDLIVQMINSALSIKHDAEILADMSLAQTVFSCSNSKKALVFAEQALSMSQQSPKAFYVKGDALLCDNDYDNAEIEYLKSIELDHNYYRAYLKLYLIERKRGNKEQAIRFYKLAEEAAPHREKRIIRTVSDPSTMK